MKTLKTTGFISICCLCMLACGFNEQEQSTPPHPGSNKSSSSAERSSGSGSSSSGINIEDLELQNAPEQSKVHGSVEVSLDPFMISKYLITQHQYQSVMGNNPSREKNDNLPVEGVNWVSAVDFCKKLSKLLGFNESAIRLPTEAEWEAASYPQVSVIQRNENYWEWTNDCFDSDFPYNGITKNPSGPPNCLPVNPVVRKGFGHWDARFPTNRDETDINGGYISFRVVIKSKDYF